MPLLTLPPEILLEIASNSSVNSIYSLVLSCRYLNHTLTETLYSFPLRRHEDALRYGLGALLSAASRRDVYVVEKMLKWGILKHFNWWVGREFEKSLFDTKEQDTTALETLLFCGMDPVTPLQGRSMPLLDLAAAAGNAPAVKALLACPRMAVPRMVVSPRGSCVHCPPPALISAVQRGFADVARILCEDGRVDVNVADGARETPVLHLAVRQGDPEIVRCLLRRGDIHVDARCPSDETALCWAAREGNLVIVRLLVEEGGADINLSCGWIQYLDSILPPARGENGGDFLLRTPLHFAAIRGHLSVVQFLVECERVDINARDVAGDTPLDHAVRHGDKKIVRVLKNNGAIDKRYAERRRIWGDVVVKIFGCFSRRVQKDAVVAGRIR